MRRFEQLDPRLMLAGDSCPEEEPAYESLAELAALFGDSMSAADAGSTTSTAYDLGTLGASRTLAGYVGGADFSDVLKFTVDAQSTVSLGLGQLMADIDLYLYDSQGRQLARSINGSTASESISATLGAGTYYILVTPWRSAQSYYQISFGAQAIAPVTPANPVTDPPATTPPATTPPATTPTDPTTPVTALPDVAYYGGANDWNLNAINAPEAWAAGYTGDGVVVAVIDTGVDVNHPDLMSQLWVNAGEIAGNGLDDDGNGYVDDTTGWDFASGDNNPDDGNGHGTHVAGTIAAAANGTGATGVAPDATIMPVRVLGNNGSGSMSSVAAGIRYAVDMGADIINLSLGGSYSSLILAAIEYAVSNNVLVVAAAGNEYASTPGYPARFSASLAGVISVGAYSSSDTIANFSNDVGNSGAVQVDAPGAGIYSTYPDGRYATLSGTSMAAPHVAGLAALALSANSSLTAAQLRSIIVAGASDTISGSDSAGGINAALTVAWAVSGQTPSSASSVSANAQAVAQVPSIRRIMVSSVTLQTDTHVASSESELPSNVVPPAWSLPAASSAPAPVIVDAAFAALRFADAWESLDFDQALTPEAAFDEAGFDEAEEGLGELLAAIV